MEIEEIVKKQKAFFRTTKTKPVEFRVMALTRLYKGIREYQEKLCQALKKDFNKSSYETYMTEIGLTLDEIRYHIRHVAGWSRNHYVPTPLAQFPSISYVSPEPYGVVLIMAPWNYPILLCLEPLIGAISAGNCAVLKPSAYTPNTSKVLAEMIRSIFPSKYVEVVEGGREENQALLEQKFDYIFFTGSVSVGKQVMEAAAKYVTPLTLELGGKSPVIVDETANLKIAARRIAFGKVLNAGQTCVEPDYLFIHESVKEQFLAEYQKALRMFFPKGTYEEMPVIVNEKHYNRLMGLLEGERPVIGGGTDGDKRFIEPTVLVDVRMDSPIMKEEIFGPILPLLTYKRLDMVIEYIRNHPKPLALYLFTSNPLAEEAVLSHCSFGGGCINDTIIHLATSHMGFGGVGESGMGQYHGKLSFETFSHKRSIVKKGICVDLPVRYHPYTTWKKQLLQLFLH